MVIVLLTKVCEFIMANGNKASSGMIRVAGDPSQFRPKAKAPKELSDDAKLYWERITANVRNDQFNESDFAVLSAYCESYVMMVRARVAIELDGMVLEDSHGKEYINPHISIMNSAISKLATLSTKVRLCPSARIKNDEMREHEPDSEYKSPLGALLKKR